MEDSFKNNDDHYSFLWPSEYFSIEEFFPSNMASRIASLQKEVMKFPPKCRAHYIEILGVCMFYTAAKIAHQLNAGERSIAFQSNIDLDRDAVTVKFRQSPSDVIDVE